MPNVAFASPQATASGPELVWGFEFDGASGRPISGGALDLSAERERGFQWLHVDLVHANTRRWLTDHESSLGAASDSMTDNDSHPHIDWRGSMLWGVVHDIHREFDDPGEHSADLRFVLTPTYLLTGRRRPVQSAHAVKRKLETGTEFETSTDLFEALLDEIIDAISRVAHRTAEALEKVEDKVLSMSGSDERAHLLGIRREVARYARLATSLRAVVARLDQTSVNGLPQACRSLTARLGQRVASLHADIQYLSDRARMLHDEVGAQVAAQTNRHLFTLTILTTLLLPPSLVTGYFGMNTKNLPFAESDFGTVYATVFVIAAAASVFMLIRRSRMLS
jgi:zinc transporter